MTKRFWVSRARVAFFHDVAMAAASYALALYLRLGDMLAYYPPGFVLEGVVLFAAVSAAVFWPMGLYRGVWRYASLNDLLAIARAVTAALFLFLLAMFLATRLEDLPRSVFIINWFVLMALLGGPRMLYRALKDRSVRAVLAREGHRRVPVLLVGAGDGTELFVRTMQRQPAAGYSVVGIVDDKGKRVGRKIHGVDVMGPLESIGEVVAQLSARKARPLRLIVTTEGVKGPRMRRLLEFAEREGMSLSRLPKLTDFRSGAADRIETRPIAIEDVLGRPQTVLDRDGMRQLIAGRRVLVTGAGGTIGSELARQISDFAPEHLTLADHSEYQLYEIDRELGTRHPEMPRRALLSDVRDRDGVVRLVREEAPQLVFHAAALKHVPIVEAQPIEGVLTNVIGTRYVADACRQAGVLAMVLISTDKAVNPASVMGATKRLAEGYCQALDIAQSPGGRTRFLTVRFGNVLGSTGSVVPLFQRQIQAGGPLTVTHPEVSRYFMTTREAVELVLEASVLGAAGKGGTGKILVLDMGEPIRILDLAKQMIRLAGLEPGADVAISFTGLRPGEKLHEELFHSGESALQTEREGILLAAPRAVDLPFLAHAIDELAEAAAAGRADHALSILTRLVPEYRPARGGAARAAAGG